MKRILKNPIFMFAIGALIFGSVGVFAAATLGSENVNYDNIKNHSSKTTVQDAIDDLYDKTSSMYTKEEYD